MSDPIGNILSISWWRQVFQKTGKAFGWGCAVVFGLPLVIGFGWNQFSGRTNQNSGAVARDTQLMTVNGEPVSMGDYYAVAGNVQMGQPGEDFARKTGEIIDALVKQVVLSQEGKRAGVRASDAEIDKAIQDIKVRRLGKNATDADLENYLFQSQHMTLADLREQVAKSFLGKSLLDDVKKKTVVTEEEARNQTAEVRLSVVLVPAIPAAAVPGMSHDPRALPDAQAMAKANALLAEVKSGKATLAAIARANSTDFNAKKGGDTDFMPEYKSAGMPASMGILGYGKDFDDAVHKAKVGDFIGVIKATGFQSGYVFAKLDDRRNNQPKDFAPQKVVDQLKEQRATETLLKKIDDLKKVAKIEFPADRIEQKAYYDYFLESQLEQQKFSSFGDPAGAPTDEQINKQKAVADNEIEAVYKKDSTNTTAAILILDALKLKLSDPKTPPADQTRLRDRLLPLYQSIIKASEGDDYAYRFGLGDALRDKKQFAEAYKNYHMVGRLLDTDIPTELKAMQDAVQVRQRLELALKTVASPEAPNAAAEATVQEQKIQELNGSIAQLQLKAKEEKSLQDAARKKQADLLKSQKLPKTGAGASANMPGGLGQPLNLGGSGGTTVTVPPGGAIKAGSAPATLPSPPPSSQTAPPAPTSGSGR